MIKRFMAVLVAALFLFPGTTHASNCVHAANVELTMPREFWDLVAVCESSIDGSTARWDDGGFYAGGLGIAKSTWKGFGGYQFASSPGKATIEEQIVVANRISVLGYVYQSGYYKQPVGFFGWGCIKHRKSLNPKLWKKKAKEALCQKKLSEYLSQKESQAGH